MTIVHLAGKHTPERGQKCVRCLHVLAPSHHNLAWEKGSEPPRGWGEGNEILIDGNYLVDLTHVADPDAFNDDQRCAEGGVVSYVLYDATTLDRYGEWIARRNLLVDGELRADPQEAACGATREECIEALAKAQPRVLGMTFVKAYADDDPVIDGTFL